MGRESVGRIRSGRRRRQVGSTCMQAEVLWLETPVMT